MLTKIYERNPSEKELQRVVDVLERDGIVIYPTDSVYAFGCSLRSPRAIDRLRRIRGKSSGELAVVFGSIAQIAEYCRVDNAAFRTLKRNLPGPFTFVLAASSRVPDKALERRQTIGVRIPANAVARAVVSALVVRSSPPRSARTARRSTRPIPNSSTSVTAARCRW